MLVYEKPYWVIYESHMTPRKAEHIPSGVRRYPAMYPFVLDVLQRSTAFPVKLDRKTMRKHLGEPYGVKDILELAKVCITHSNGTQPDREGLICSEYAALCYPKIIKDLNLPAHCITPGHWLQYLSSK